MSYGRRSSEELRRAASANLSYIMSGGLQREKLERERLAKAEKDRKAQAKAEKTALRLKIKELKKELKETERFYHLIEQDKADIGLLDAAHKQGALEEVDSAREGIVKELGDCRELLRSMK